MEHDGNAGALAELYFGAGKGFRNIVFLTMGTGFGAGLILDGRLYRGTTDVAGEIGHIRIAEDGPRAYGKPGSLEGFASGPGLSALARLMFPEHWPAAPSPADLSTEVAAGKAGVVDGNRKRQRYAAHDGSRQRAHRPGTERRVGRVAEVKPPVPEHGGDPRDRAPQKDGREDPGVVDAGGSGVEIRQWYVAGVAAERAQVAVALRVSEERLRLALSAADMGVFEWNVAADQALWENDRIYEIFGHTRDDGALSKAEFFADYLHPDDAAAFELALDEAAQQPELGRNPVIASVSLGAARRFCLRHRRRKDLKVDLHRRTAACCAWAAQPSTTGCTRCRRPACPWANAST